MRRPPATCGCPEARGRTAWLLRGDSSGLPAVDGALWREVAPGAYWTARPLRQPQTRATGTPLSERRRYGIGRSPGCRHEPRRPLCLPRPPPTRQGGAVITARPGMRHQDWRPAGQGDRIPGMDTRKQVFGMTEEQALQLKGNPSICWRAGQGANPLCTGGASGRQVPVAENTTVLAERYRHGEARSR